MDKLKYLKAGVGLIAGSGASYIVTSFIKDNVEPETIIQKVTVPIGRIALAMMFSDMIRTFTDTKIDKLAKEVTEQLTKMKALKE